MYPPKPITHPKIKLLITHRSQFGYHFDTYSYCVVGAKLFEITYFGFDVERDKIVLYNVGIKHISRKGSKPVRYLRFLLSLMKEVQRDYDIIFVGYFPGCSLVRILNPRKRFVVDIRTGSIVSNKYKRKLENMLMWLECNFFKNITCISRSLTEKLRLPRSKTHILPLGAEPLDLESKTFGELHLLYVGTFGQRRLEDTIEGFERFYREFRWNVNLSYTLIGNGNNRELEKMRKIVEQKGLSDVVCLPGFIHKLWLGSFFERCNIGISYIPKTEFFEVQPSTKTFEYLFAGMPVIATATLENKRVIRQDNGILIEDNPESFYKGLIQLYKNRSLFDSRIIKETCAQYSWERIVKENLRPYLGSICEC